MAKPTFIAVFFTLALGSSLAHAQHTVDDDGFKQPLQHLQFNPGLDQREFERSTLNALNVYDPLESWNRRVYHFNYRFDEWVFLPIVDGYRYITPNLVQTGVSNFFSNLGDVPNLLNSALQLKGTLGRWRECFCELALREGDEEGAQLVLRRFAIARYLRRPLIGQWNS